MLPDLVVAPADRGVQRERVPAPDVLVHAIVLNYRTAALTTTAVNHLLASDYPPDLLRIWIVDNASGDGSVQVLQQRFPEAQIIVSDRNNGFAAGNNLAMRAILAETPQDAERAGIYVLLLNSDTEAQTDAIPELVRFLDTHPDTGIVGPKLVLADGSLDLACRRGFPTPQRAFWKLTGLSKLFPRNPRFAGYNLTHLDEDEVTEVDSVVGACMLLRLAAIEQVGLLDESFFMYGEDLDWAFRIKERGWRVYYDPRARVRHLKGASARRQPYRMIYEFYRAMWIFHRKHYAAASPFLLNCVVSAGIIVRCGVAVGLNAVRSAERIRAG